MSRLRKEIEAIYTFPPEELEEFLASWTPITIAKGEILIRAGESSSHLYFLESGAIRCFNVHQGKETTEWIGLEGRFVYSPTALFLQEPGRLFFQVVESSLLYAIHVQDLEARCAKSIHAAQFYRLMLTKGILAAEKRVEILMATSAVQRYRNLVSHFPDLIQRVPLSFIASYIGITKETLSRVRGRKSPML